MRREARSRDRRVDRGSKSRRRGGRGRSGEGGGKGRGRRRRVRRDWVRRRHGRRQRRRVGEEVGEERDGVCVYGVRESRGPGSWRSRARERGVLVKIGVKKMIDGGADTGTEEGGTGLEIRDTRMQTADV